MKRISVLLFVTYVWVCAAAADPGAPAPACTLRSFDEDAALVTDAFRGRVVYVDFWASWCAPCAKSFLFMDELRRSFDARALQILAINLDEKPDDARAFLERNPRNFVVAVDADGRCARSFGVEAMPSSYLVDRHGTVRYVHRGFRSGDGVRLTVLVRELIAESDGEQPN